MREFSLPDLHGLFSGSEPWVGAPGETRPADVPQRPVPPFQLVLGPWILPQITAELSEEQSYQAWLAQNQAAAERITGKQAAAEG